MMIAASERVQTAGLFPEEAPLAEKQRFTLDGSDALEDHLELTCQRVLDGVRATTPGRTLEGLLLGGGYGRGEGGVLSTDIGDQPYNDLEFYVFLRGNSFLSEYRYRAALHALAQRLSPDARVEIEFKVLSLAKLRRSATSMYFYDFVTAHRWLHGRECLLAGCDHHRDAKNIPMSEATRLMMNRCAGLLFARERLRREPFTLDDADFVGRNLAKAQLAFGDVVLAAFGLYHWSCRERRRRLEKLEAAENLRWLPEVLELHSAGVQFKLHPRRSTASRATLLKEHERISSLGLHVWLWLENRRLRHDFKSVRDYAFSSINKCPETNPWRNLCINTWHLGSTGPPIRKFTRHPREQLFETFPVLLWKHDARAAPESSGGKMMTRNATGSPRAGSMQAFELLWSHFN